MADTAWELFHRLDREEVDLYLADRGQQRFHGNPSGRVGGTRRTPHPKRLRPPSATQQRPRISRDRARTSKRLLGSR
ncbi:MAG: DUF4038 domain-containing protein [Planctomycetota bacterium]